MMRLQTDGAINQFPRMCKFAGTLGIVAVFLSGCSGTSSLLGSRAVNSNVTTGSIATKKAKPDSAVHTAILKAREHRAKRQHAKAFALLSKTAETHAGNKDLEREQGMMALELGRPEMAERHLKASLVAGPGDWRTHSALGSALASQNRHQDAQKSFSKALQLAPGNPSVMNNLAMSHVMNGQISKAEQLLRQAAWQNTDSAYKGQIRQNLALVLGLRGDVREAHKITRASLSPADADANIAFLRSLQDGNIKISRRTAPIEQNTKLAKKPQKQ